MSIKKIAVTISIASIAILGSACQAEDSSASETVDSSVEVQAKHTVIPKTVAPKSTTVNPSPTLSESDKDKLFIKYLEINDVPLVSAAPEQAVDLAHTICDALSSGVSLRQLAVPMLKEFTPTQAGQIMGAAVGAYCPENEGLIG